MKKVLLIVFLFFLFFKSNAQIILGSDNAGNYSTWSHGSNQGTGFGNWDMWKTGTAGFFLGSSNASGFGNIDTSSKSFGMYGNTGSGDYSHAQRFLSSVTGSSANSGRYHLLSGQSFEIDLAIAYRNGNKGIDLLNDSYNLLYTVYVKNEKYMVTGGEINPVWAYSQTSIIHIKVWQISDTQMRVMLTRGSDSFDSGVISGVFSGFKLFEGNTSSGVLNNLYFNNLVVKSGDIVTTWDGTAWDNGTPNELKKAVINGNFTSNGTDQLPFTAQSLTINADKTLTISPTHTITVQNAITNNGTITVEHQGSLVQTNDAAVNIGSGTYQVKKTTGAYKNYDYFYWASPINNFAIENAFPIGAGNFPNYRYKFNPELFEDAHSGAYTQTTGTSDGYDDNNNDWTMLNNGNVVPQGIGFITMGKESAQSFSTSLLNVSHSGFNVSFNGSINNGIIPVTVKKDDFSSLDTWNINMNFIGNPYPSAIDLNKLYLENSTVLDGSFYFWMHNSPIEMNDGPNAYDYNNSNFAAGVLYGTGTDPNNYTFTTINTSLYGTDVPLRYAASCQGFMVGVQEISESSTTINFKNNMRVSGNNTSFAKTQNTTNTGVDRIWLNLVNDANVFSQIAVGFAGSTTDDWGIGDAARMDTAAATDFYSVIPEVNGQFAIQFLSDFVDSKIVPLGIGVQQTGNFSINIDHVDGIFTEGQKIYLEDTYEEVIHELNVGAYSFTQTAGTNINDRFILRFTNTQLGHEEAVLENLKLYPNPTKGLLNIAYTGSEPLQITLYNQVGHTVGTYEGVQVLDLSQLAQGMYFAKIANSQGSVTRKIVLE